MNAPAVVTLPASGLVTVTSAGPTAPGGVVTTIAEALTDVTVAATPPNVTATPVWKSAPEITTSVPPVRKPKDGLTDVIVGGVTAAHGVVAGMVAANNWGPHTVDTLR